MNYDDIAKWSQIISALVFYVVLVWMWFKFLAPALKTAQVNQNKVISEAERHRDEAKNALEALKHDIDGAKQDAKLIRARADEHIWDEAKAARVNLPAICHQGRCLTCAGKLLEPGEFDPSDAVSYYPQDREAGYILLCTAKARSNLRIRAHMQTEMRAHRKKFGLPAPYA